MKEKRLELLKNRLEFLLKHVDNLEYLISQNQHVNTGELAQYKKEICDLTKEIAQVSLLNKVHEFNKNDTPKEEQYVEITNKKGKKVKGYYEKGKFIPCDFLEVSLHIGGLLTFIIGVILFWLLLFSGQWIWCTFALFFAISMPFTANEYSKPIKWNEQNIKCWRYL